MINLFRKIYSKQYGVFFWISFSIVLLLNLFIWLYLGRVEDEFRGELRERMIDINQVFSRLMVEITETNSEMDLGYIVPGDHSSIHYLYYRQLLEDIRQNSELQSIMLIAVNGGIIVSSPEQILRQGFSSISNSSEFQKAENGKIVVSEIHEYLGEKFVSAFAPIKDLEGFVSAVLVIEAKADFFAVLAALKNRLLLFSAITLLLITMTALILFRVIRRSIRYQTEIKDKEHLVQLGTMAAAVAHELRNPLNIIEASNDVIKKKYCQDDDEVFEYIPQEVKRLNILISDFLKFAGMPRLEISRFSPAEIVRRLEMSCSAENRDRCKIDVSSNLPELHTDMNLAEQAFLNVFTNALEASESGGIVQVNIFAERKKIIIDIKDEGKGIDEQNLKDIFLPFFSTKEKGTGLGLAITRRLIDILHGTINIQSSTAGGTHVRIKLPDIRKYISANE